GSATHTVSHRTHRSHAGGHAADLHELTETAGTVFHAHRREHNVVALFLLRFGLRLHGDVRVQRSNFDRWAAHECDLCVAYGRAVIGAGVVALPHLGFGRSHSDADFAHSL